MSDDGQPDEAKEWEDLEGIEQNMYPEDIHDQYVAVLAAVDDDVPCSCGKSLRGGNLEMYPHDGGIYVPNKVSSQWVSVQCKHCGFQNSWTKILRRMKRK